MAYDNYNADGSIDNSYSSHQPPRDVNINVGNSNKQFPFKTLTIIVFALIIFLLLFKEKPYNSYKYERQIDSLTTLVKSQKDSIVASQHNVQVYKDSIAALGKQKQLVDRQIDTLKTKYAQKIKVIHDTYTVDSIQSFYDSRYGFSSDVNKVTLPQAQATLGVIDIVKGDECTSELNLTSLNLKTTERQLSLSDSVSAEKDRQITHYGNIINLNDDKFKVKDKEYAALQKNYNHLKFKDGIKTGIGVTALVAVITIIATK